MNADTQAVLLNAVPLLLLAALYLAVGVAIAPADWRRRGRRGEALVLPLVGAAAAILGIAVLVEREPLAGNAALSLVGIAVAALPLALVLRDRAAGQVPADSLSVTPQIADMNGLSRRLLSADDPRRVAVMLLDELTARHDLELASLALVEDEGRRAVVAAAREGGADIEALLAQEIDLDREASGISAALREGAPFAVYDAEASEVVNKRLNEIAKAKSCAFVPVRAGEGIIGVVFAAVRRPRLFDEQELAQMDAVTALAGLALERTRLLRERTRQAHAERAFYRMAAALSEPLSAEETLDAVAQAAAEALGGDSAAVLRREAHGLELAGRYELAETLAVHLRAGGDALVECCRGGNVLAARSLRGDGRFGPALADAAEAADRRSLLLVPLADAARGEGGLVLVFFREERDFGDDVLELATQVGAAAHGAIERSNLYERERRSRSLAQRLAHAGRGLAGELDPDDVLDRTVQLALDLVGADGASVRVLEGDEVVVRAAAGPGAEDVLETHAPSTGWLVGDIVQTRTTRSIQDVREDARHVEADPMLEAGYAAYLGVPVIGPEESVRGVLAVYASQPRDWREEEVEALSALASSAAAAGANAELYQGVSHEQQRSEAILANVADGIVAVDREGRVVLWNPAAERVTGVPAAEALGRTPTEALGRSLDAEGGVPGGSRLLPIRRGGEEVWLSLSEAVMTDPAGAVAGRIYAFRDISAERSVEQMKSDFVSTVSHELRTPLTSIYGFAETLLRQDVLFGEDERATFLRYISSESERLTAIVDRLLSVAELDTGAIAVQLAETDVGAVVGEAVRSVESADGANGHRFVVELADEPLAAEADGEKLGQVLAHLLDNAVRYSPAGGTVTVAARRRDDAVEVSVEDEGVGIPHAERERIFRKFYRGEGASSATVGAGAAGLGLFLAEGLVKAMGGRIWVDSNEGQGSTFRFVLPAAESET